MQKTCWRYSTDWCLGRKQTIKVEKFAFLQLRDGTAYFQGIVVKTEVGEEVFQLAKNLNQETAVLVTGEIREDSRSKFGYEIGISGIEVVAKAMNTQSHRKSTAPTS